MLTLLTSFVNFFPSVRRRPAKEFSSRATKCGMKVQFQHARQLRTNSRRAYRTLWSKQNNVISNKKMFVKVEEKMNCKEEFHSSTENSTETGQVDACDNNHKSGCEWK